MNSPQAANESGLLFVISGPSGVGKTVLCNRMIQKFAPGVVYSISGTSRAPRGGEVNGQEYFFYSREAFEKDISENAFAEWAIVHGNYYGTPKSFLDEKLANGLHVILNIDVQGALKIKNAYPECILIFIMPPSMAVLEERLRGRNMDQEEALQNRLANARREIEFRHEYDHVLVNDDLDKAVTELADIFRKHFQMGH
ncbi:MAG: guanylate kinase [Candidatus Riflebacteria bacterium]|nr:guanylate kinase [Candidatus Riflebacteria bacterium]